MTPAFLDANIPVYAVGRPHPLKDPCLEVLAIASAQPSLFMTDVEVLQELLHRYLALRMWPEKGKPVFERFLLLMRDRIEPIYAADVVRAAALAERHPHLAARDLLHAAVMARLGIRHIVSADTGFDRLPAIERLDPADVAKWRDALLGEESPF